MEVERLKTLVNELRCIERESEKLLSELERYPELRERVAGLLRRYAMVMRMIVDAFCSNCSG